MTLIYLTLAWMAGIVVAEQAEPSRSFSLVMIGVAAAGVVAYRNHAAGRIIFGMMLLLGAGMLRFAAADPDADHVARLNDQGHLSLRGVVVAEPLRLDQGLQVLIEAEEAGGHPVKGRVLARLPRYSAVRYGDRLQIDGMLRTPAEFDTFSYRDYLARQGVFSVMYNADGQVLAHDQGSPFYAALLEAKDRARRFITRSLPEPQASLLTGILLGDDSGLPAETKEAFNRTGTSHIIAISGFNMVILAGTIMGLLRLFLEKRQAAALAIVVIILYTLLVGAGASVVRAAVMSGIAILADVIRRKTYVPTSLAFAAFLMSLFDPFALWDVGFQLSFAAVLGMALFVPPMERALTAPLENMTTQAQRVIKMLSEPLLVTAAAQVTTLPLTLYYFGRLSILSLGINLLVIPVQAPLLILGGVGASVGLLIPPLGELILYADWLFLTWSVKVVEYFAGIEWSSREIRLGQGSVIVFFAGLLVVMLYRATRPRWAMRLLRRENLWASGLAAAGIVAAVLLFATRQQQPDGKLHVAFLDVGGANGMLIESPKGASILIDGGQLSSQLLDQLGDLLPARTRHLDALIVTAPQEEHIAALPEVLDRYRVGAVLTNGQPSTSESFAALMERIREKNIPLTAVTAGYQLRTDDGLTIEVLNPLAVPAKGDPPALAGLVLRVSYGDAVFILAGSIQAATETLLLENPHLLQAAVLQIPDHGSAEASSLPFLRVVNPQVTVLQLGVERDPSPTVISRLAGTRLFRTDQAGLIEVVTDGRRLWVYAG